MFWKEYRDEMIRLQKKQVSLLQILVDARPEGHSVQTARLKQDGEVFSLERYNKRVIHSK